MLVKVYSNAFHQIEERNTLSKNSWIYLTFMGLKKKLDDIVYGVFQKKNDTIL